MRGFLSIGLHFGQYFTVDEERRGGAVYDGFVDPRSEIG
jgi:hypothetical protein